jgi:hypothetical protein
MILPIASVEFPKHSSSDNDSGPLLDTCLIQHSRLPSIPIIPEYQLVEYETRHPIATNISRLRRRNTSRLDARDGETEEYAGKEGLSCKASRYMAA